MILYLKNSKTQHYDETNLFLFFYHPEQDSEDLVADLVIFPHVGNHNNRLRVLLPNQLPEVIHSVLCRILSCNELVRMFVTLKNTPKIILTEYIFQNVWITMR